MSDDLIARLRHAHEHSQQRIVGSNIFQEAATALEAKDAEIERLRGDIEYQARAHARLVSDLQATAEQAERALAEAVGVLRPFADCIDQIDTLPDGYPWRDDQSIIKGLKMGSLRAARAFVAQHGSDSREGK